MKITSIYFSPTGTTKKVVDNIIKGIGSKDITKYDLTLNRNQNIVINSDLVIFGMPVYEQKIPLECEKLLKTLHGKGINTIILSCYGNVVSGIALSQMYQILTKNEFNVVAAASFIGEHSFSRDNQKIAEARPDKKDCSIAMKFGKDILKKLNSSNAEGIELPIKRLPLKNKLLPKKMVRFISKRPEVNRFRCNLCKKCTFTCPVGAIDKESLFIDKSKCLRCYKCVRVCPKKAREIKLRPNFIIKNALKFKARKRQEPKIYI